MASPPAPDPRELLPPLLACLPTTFVSPRPPPALLPLLAPVLRQRLSYLATSGTPSSDGWVRLLSWDADRAAKLPSIVEHLELEPHPVSGEVEIDDVDAMRYRRLDEETLHSRLEVAQFDLLPIYVWCETDEHGGTGPGWKLTELRSLEDVEDGAQWFERVAQANDAASTTSIAVPQANENSNGYHVPDAKDEQIEEDDDDDEGYWAAYDQTPGGRTPATKRSPAPPSNAGQNARDRSQSELEYFARYSNEVQPALDSHDPDEDHPELGNSSLTGTTQRTRSPLVPAAQQQDPTTRTAQPKDSPPDDRPDWQKALYPHVSAHPADSVLPTPEFSSLEQPRAISPTSSIGSVEALERKAERDDRAEMGIKMHIATDIKSLYRLARSVGMERGEFERVVRTELEVLGMMDEGA
nr:hypothetical protein B0A51_07265 [Rachicladosporium sp. CCFEE 5018]